MLLQALFMNTTSINFPMLKTDLNDQVIHILSQQDHQQHSFQCWEQFTAKQVAYMLKFYLSVTD